MTEQHLYYLYSIKPHCKKITSLNGGNILNIIRVIWYFLLYAIYNKIKIRLLNLFLHFFFWTLFSFLLTDQVTNLATSISRTKQNLSVEQEHFKLENGK